MENKCSDCLNNALSYCHSKKYCGKCLNKHILSSLRLTHITTPLESKSFDHCICCDNPSDFYCNCKGLLQKYCSKCFVFHINDGSYEVSHEYRALFPDSEISSEFSSLKNRLKKLEYLESGLKKNMASLQRIDSFLSTELNSLKTGVLEYFESTELEIIKAENYLDSITKELNSCKWDTDLSENEVFQKYNLFITKGKILNLVETELSTDHFFASLKNLFTISLKEELFKPDSRLYYFKSRSKELYIVDLKSSKVFKKQNPKSSMIKDSGSWCEISKDQVFYCGGVQGSVFYANAYLIDPNNFSITPVSDMIQSRALSPVVYYKKYVYVFGGYSGKNLSSGEKYSMELGKWKEIANMPIARSAFSVVVYGGYFYMTGDNKNIDRYDPVLDIFDTFTDVLPSPSGYSTLVCCDSNLYIFQNISCLEIDLESMKYKNSYNIPQGKWWSCFPSVEMGNDFYFSRYDDNSVWSFSTKNKTLNKVLKP